MTEAKVDADAFNAFEAAGWEKQAAGYEDFFGQVTTRLADPLLDAAEIGPGERVLDWPQARTTSGEGCSSLLTSLC